MTTLRIIFEDDNLIAVNKPAGQLVIPGRGDPNSRAPEGARYRAEAQHKPLVDQVASHIRKKAYVVHRIDRETSGLVVFAKDPKTHRELCTLWEGRPPSPVSGRNKREDAKASADSLLFVLDEGRRVHKTYLAWVLGRVEKKEGLLDYPLRTFGSGRMGVDPKAPLRPSSFATSLRQGSGRQAASEDRSGFEGLGKPSQTWYKVLKTTDTASYLEVEPLTGRRHQIRVHLYHAGHPILGDPLYGQDRPVGGAPRLMLHAHRLQFLHDGKKLDLISDIPPDFVDFPLK